MGAAPHEGEAQRDGWDGGLGSRALVVGWVAEVVEAAAMVVAVVKRAALGLRLRFQVVLCRAVGRKQTLVIDSNGPCALLMLPYCAMDISL